MRTHALDEPEQKRPSPSSSLIRLVSADRERRRTGRSRAPGRRRPCRAHMPLEIGSSSSGSCALRRDRERLEADRERLARARRRRGRPASGSARRRGPGDERERLDRDLAVGALERVQLAVGDLLGQRLAHGDRPRGDAAHHHALEDGLAADGGIALRHQGAVGKAGLFGTRDAYDADEPRAARSARAWPRGAGSARRDHRCRPASACPCRTGGSWSRSRRGCRPSSSAS